MNTELLKPRGNTEHSKIDIGDVLRLNGKLMICDRINESAARVRPLTKKVNIIQPRGDKEKFGGAPVKFAAPDIAFERISAGTPGPFVARLGAEWMKADLATIIPGFEGEPNIIKEKPAPKPPKVFRPNESVAAAAVESTAKAATDRPLPKEGKCAFLVTLLEAGELTRAEMVKLAVEKFGGTIEGTTRTISAIPSAMRRAGKEPKWRTI